MTLAGNDTSHYQSTGKLIMNMKFNLKCNERLVFKLFLILLTNYYDI